MFRILAKFSLVIIIAQLSLPNDAVGQVNDLVRALIQEGLKGLQNPNQHRPDPFARPDSPPRKSGTRPDTAFRSGPSFDCSRARSAAEITICSSPPLATLDDELARAHRATMTGLSGPELTQERARNKAWLARREKCGSGRACLERSYRQRLAELTGPTPAFDDSSQSLEGTTLKPPRAAAASGFSAEALVHPDSAWKPLRLRLLNGLPVFHLSTDGDSQAFFRLVALGMRPSFIEERGRYEHEDNARNFALEFLPSSDPILSAWRGDEFEREDARKTFLTAYADKLRRRAPKAPFSFIYSYDTKLPSYDQQRQGFILQSFRASELPIPNLGAVKLVADFEEPKDLLWRINEPGARRVLANLRERQKWDDRTVRLAVELTATKADAETLTLHLALRKISVYDSGLTTPLYEFDTSPFQIREPEPVAAQGFSKLIAPPPGFRPWSFRTLDGLPVMPILPVVEPADQYVGAAHTTGYRDKEFFSLLAGASFGFDDKNAVGLASIILSNRAKKEVFVHGYNPTAPTTPWAGSNEFERARSRDLFYQRYVPLFKDIAPKPPFTFVWVQEARLPDYDFSRGGIFVYATNRDGSGNSRSLPDLMNDVAQAGLKPDPTFTVPEIFWPMDAATAQARLASLPDRKVSMAAVVEAVKIDPETTRMSLRLKALRLYTPDLKKKLFEVPVTNDQPAFAESGTPERLQVAPPVVLDETFLCIELLATAGEATPRQELDHCWRLVAKRDAGFYDRNSDPSGLAPDDARRPFFPRAGLSLNDKTRASFLAWAKAYAAGLPPTVVSMPSTSSKDPFPAISGTDTGYKKHYEALLQKERLQEDQLVAFGAIYNLRVLVVLPTAASAYSATLPKPLLDETKGSSKSSISEFRLGPTRMVARDDGTPALAISLTPLKTTISASGKDLMVRDFDDIPALDAGSFVAAPESIATKTATGPLPLDAALIDMLAAKAVGTQLSDEALAYLVTRRWRFESDPRNAPDMHFFARGKRQPTPEEAASLGKEFVAWASANTPELPLRVTVSGQHSLQKGEKTTSWGEFACFSASFASMGTNATIADCRRRGDASLAELQHCAAAAAAQKSSRFSATARGPCAPKSGHLGFNDPFAAYFSFSHLLPTPAVPILGDKRLLDARATLDITGIRFAPQEPLDIDVLPDNVQRGYDSHGSRKTGEFVVLDTTLVEVEYRDPGGAAEVARLDPDPKASMAAIVREYEEDLRAASAKNEMDSNAFRPDLIGIRLGMTFVEAEQIIRSRMKVGTVLQGKRAFDEAGPAGFPKPLTSGKLFISEDELELVALLDEPPTAAGRVLVAWRRINMPAESTPTSELFARLVEKYGPPSDGHGPMQTGVPRQWFGPAGKRCSSIYQGGRKSYLAETWYQDGKPTTYGLERNGLPAGVVLPNEAYREMYEKMFQAYYKNSQSPVKGPILPDALSDPLSERNRGWKDCGPFVSVEHLEARNAGGRYDQLDMTLTDIGPYATAYEGSVQQFQKTANVKPPRF
jgi:uncharacterized protein